MIEEWRPVVGYEGVYEVSSIGRVKRTAGGQGAQPGIRKLGVHPNGYVQVVLSMDNIRATKKVHRLVAEAFLGPGSEGMEVCHNNDVPGDNRLENLRWDTHHANCIEREQNGKPRKQPTPSVMCRSRQHLMVGENVKILANGWRQCVSCYKAKCARRPKGYDRAVTCRNGHPRTESNVYVSPDGRRDCRDCRREIDRKRYNIKRKKF